MQRGQTKGKAREILALAPPPQPKATPEAEDAATVATDTETVTDAGEEIEPETAEETTIVIQPDTHALPITTPSTPQRPLRFVPYETTEPNEQQGKKRGASPDWLEKAEQGTREDGWGPVIRGSSNFVRNLKWDRAVWRSTAHGDKTHVMGLRGLENSRGAAHLWAIGEVSKAPSLSFLNREFNTWSIELDLPNDQTRSIVDGLKMHGILGQAWTGDSVATRFYAATNKGFISQRISLLDDAVQKENLRRDLDRRRFPLMYDGEEDSNPGPGQDPDEVVKGRLVAVEFQIHSRNYRTAETPTGGFDYSFRLQSVYLVRRPAESVSTPRKRLRALKEKEWIEQPPRMRDARFGESPLEYNMTQQAMAEAMAGGLSDIGEGDDEL